MLGNIAMVLLLHAAFSTLRFRKYVQANQETFSLPLDIILELTIAIIFAYYSIIALTSRFKPAKEFHQNKSYDATFYKPNFRNLRNSRAQILLPFLKQRLNTQNFELDLKL